MVYVSGLAFALSFVSPNISHTLVSPPVTRNTVSGQNIIGIYIIDLTFMQHTDHKYNTMYNNQLLKLHPAVIDKMLFEIIGC